MTKKRVSSHSAAAPVGEARRGLVLRSKFLMGAARRVAHSAAHDMHVTEAECLTASAILVAAAVIEEGMASS